MEQLNLFDKKENERIINGKKVDPLFNFNFCQGGIVDVRFYTRSTTYSSITSTNLNYDWGSNDFTYA